MSARAKPGLTDLATTHPELAAQAMFDPQSVTSGSGKRLPWRCELGHEWTANVGSRARNGRGCPYCANKAVWPGFNDLTTTNPNLASEAHGWDPSTVTEGSGKIREWWCVAGHAYLEVVGKRSSGYGCAICAGKRVLIGFNDLASTKPDLALQALFDPTTVTTSSGYRGEWRCSVGHEWTATVAARSRGRGCPICGNKAVLPGYNDLATTNPALAAEACFNPRSVTAGSNKPLEWRCSLGHHWTAQVASRNRGRGCPICASRRLLPGFNDLATVDPELAKEACFDPTTVMPFSHSQLPWKCPHGHHYETSPAKRSSGNGCSVCAGKVVVPGINDLATTHPDVAAEALFDPTTVTSFSDRMLDWRCPKAHEYRARLANRTANSSGCPYCANFKVLSGFNDLSTTHPHLDGEALFDTTQVIAGSKTKRRWRCDLGHEWSAAPGDRATGKGCPSCAIHGFSPARPGWLYLLRHDDWAMQQVGITNVPTDRLRFHGAKGWEIMEIRGPMNGDLAQGWEAAILDLLVSLEVRVTPCTPRGEPSRAKARVGRGKGEAWWISDFSATSLGGLLASIHADEAN